MPLPEVIRARDVGCAFARAGEGRVGDVVGLVTGGRAVGECDVEEEELHDYHY